MEVEEVLLIGQELLMVLSWRWGRLHSAGTCWVNVLEEFTKLLEKSFYAHSIREH